MPNKVDIAGEKYGKLTALFPTDKRTKSGGVIWTFKCDCGKIKDIPANSVRMGLVKSCGCLAAPHRGTGTRLFTIWVDMRQRCNNSNIPNFNDYGGRGISVCSEWDKSFIAFRNWAKQNGYSKNLSIDRINVNGNYEPSNCRWATSFQQAMNTRKTRIITIGRESKPLKYWCQAYKIPEETIYRRVRKYGWSFEKALITPRLRNRNYSRKWQGDDHAED